jgi:hypothetical protein
MTASVPRSRLSRPSGPTVITAETPQAVVIDASRVPTYSGQPAGSRSTEGRPVERAPRQGLAVDGSDGLAADDH